MHDEIDERCTRTRELLAAAMDAELSSEEQSACESHLAECEACRSAASWLELATALAKDAPAPDALPEQRMEHVVDAVMARIAGDAAKGGQLSSETKRPRRRAWSFAPALASLAALSVLAFVLLRSPELPGLNPATEPILQESEGDGFAGGRALKPKEIDATTDELALRQKEIDGLADERTSQLDEDGASEGFARTREAPDEDGELGKARVERRMLEEDLVEEEQLDEAQLAEAQLEEKLLEDTRQPSDAIKAEQLDSPDASVRLDDEAMAALQGSDALPNETPSPAAASEERAELRDANAPSRLQKSSGMLQSAAPSPTEDAFDWEAIGERAPESAAHADSLRERLQLRMEDEEDAELRAALLLALDEVDRLWPQDPDSN